MPSGESPVAMAAASPPLEPPAVRSGFHGFRVSPKTPVVGFPPECELRDVCLRKRDGSRGTKPGDDGRVA